MAIRIGKAKQQKSGSTDAGSIFYKSVKTSYPFSILGNCGSPPSADVELGEYGSEVDYSMAFVENAGLDFDLIYLTVFFSKLYELCPSLGASKGVPFG